MSKLLLYCTKEKLSLRKSIKDNDYYLDNGSEFNIIPKEDYKLNGKIVAECDFEVEKIIYDWYPCNILPAGEHYYTYYRTNKIEPKEFYEKSCLNWEQLNSYLNDYDSQAFKSGYAIHIKNLHIFDKPIELEKCSNDNFSSCINYAPQNMMYSWLYTDKWNRYVLISIRPEWLCKILNGEKTIEVRKKVLKEMK